MLTLSSDHTIFKMSPANLPAAKARSGETVCFETLDCFGCQITSAAQLLNGIDWSNINPATGPLFVEDALPGDVLKVEILKLRLADYGVMTDAPREGVIGKVLEEESTKIIPIARGMAIFNEKLAFPICPMIGVIGTAPTQTEIDTGTPGEHGGNMDCKKIGAGSVLYLPVLVEGALLAMGDLHALMGDGEVVVCGIEAAGSVTVRVTVLKNCGLPTPFLVTPKESMAIYSSETLEEAGVGATLRMREFLIREAGMEEHDAGMVLSVAGNLRICQVVDPKMTCRMELTRYVTDQYGYLFP